MPTFPIYEGFSQFEVIVKTNPDIPIGNAKIPQNPDFLKIFPILRQLSNRNFQRKFKIPCCLFTPANQKSGQTVTIVINIYARHGRLQVSRKSGYLGLPILCHNVYRLWLRTCFDSITLAGSIKMGSKYWNSHIIYTNFVLLWKYQDGLQIRCTEIVLLFTQTSTTTMGVRYTMHHQGKKKPKH
jgi:hypothetical protein